MSTIGGNREANYCPLGKVCVESEKTTLLRRLADFIPEPDCIVVIEDTSEGMLPKQSRLSHLPVVAKIPKAEA